MQRHDKNLNVKPFSKKKTNATILDEKLNFKRKRTLITVSVANNTNPQNDDGFMIPLSSDNCTNDIQVLRVAQNNVVLQGSGEYKKFHGEVVNFSKGLDCIMQLLNELSSVLTASIKSVQ